MLADVDYSTRQWPLTAGLEWTLLFKTDMSVGDCLLPTQIGKRKRLETE